MTNRLVPQDTFFSRDHVSIWLGNFVAEVGEDSLDDYLSDEFENDYCLKPREGDSNGEYSVTESARSIYNLISDCHLSKSYINDSVELCNSKGWFQATTVSVLLWTKFDPVGLRINENAKLTFIGSVRLQPGEGARTTSGS